jgi:hypothetical protein
MCGFHNLRSSPNNLVKQVNEDAMCWACRTYGEMRILSVQNVVLKSEHKGEIVDSGIEESIILKSILTSIRSRCSANSTSYQ